MSEDKEITTQPIDAPREKTPDTLIPLESTPTTPKSDDNNEQKEETTIDNDPNDKIEKNPENDTNKNDEETKPRQEPDLNDSLSDPDSNIKNKELKSLMQLTKEANLNMSIPEKLESKRLMRSQFSEIGVNKPKGKAGQGPNILEKDDDASLVEGGGGKKRKRDSSSDSMIGGVVDGQNKELLKATMELVGKNKDGFCWKCHRDGITMSCATCPRSYHSKCLKNITATTHWICPECTGILTAENTKTRSPALKDMPLGHLCKLLKFALKRMVQINDSEPFVSPVNESEFPDYRNYIVQPMDFTMLEKNIKANSYGSTKAFEADAKWLLHNSIVFNSIILDQSKLTTVAKSILKICKQEMIEIENCSSCYLNANTNKSWFVEVCPKPHLLVWAKLKGFPYWPAKVMCTNNQGSVDVRFFGAHDRAWVSVKDCYLYSVKDPNATQNKKDEINECVKEVESYINNLKNVYGKFNYPPYRTPFQPENNTEQIQMFLPTYKSETKNEKTSPNKLQSDEEDWEVRKYIEEGKSAKSPSPDDTTPKRGPKKPLKTYSSEDIISHKRSRRNSLQSNSSRASNISDKVISKVEVEPDEKKESGKIKISDKLIKKLAPEVENKKDDFVPKETVLGTIENDLKEIKERINPVKKEGINPIQIKIKAIANMKKPKKNLNANKNVSKVTKPKYKIEMVDLKQDTFDDEEEDSLLEEMYSIEEKHFGKVSKIKNINGTPKRKRIRSVMEFSSPIESKLLKLVDVDLIKNPKLHPLDVPGHTLTPIIKEKRKDNEKNKVNEKNDEEIQIKTEIESEDDDYNESSEMFSRLHNKIDTKTQESNEDLNKNDPVNKKSAKKMTDNINKRIIELNDIEKITKGSEKLLKPTSLLKIPIKIPQTSLLKTKQLQKSETNLNNTAKITTTPGLDSGGMMILTQPKQFLNNQLVLPPNQNITYGSNSISFVQHPQFQNYLIPTSAINVNTLSLPVSNSSASTTLITNLTTTSSTSLLTTTTPTFIISKPISSLNPSNPAKLPNNNKSSPLTKPLPPLCGPQVSLSSQITLTAITNPTTTTTTNNNNNNNCSTSSVSSSIPPPLCSLTPTSTSVVSNQIVSTSTNSQNNGAVTQKDDFNYLSGCISEKLMKALTETTTRPPPPLLTAKPTTNNVSGICERIVNSTGPIAMKINSATHKLTDYFRETLIKFLSEFSTSDTSSTEAEIALLKLEMENLKQQHNMEILEMKQNLQTILKEVHRNFSEERQRAVDEIRRDCELEAQKRIEEAKSKQWCSVCGKEAQFYCCWNTSYCDYPCQIKHWPTHIDKCTQSCTKIDCATNGNGKQGVASVGKKSGGLSKVLVPVSTESSIISANKPKVYTNSKTSVQNKTSNLSKVVTLL